MATRARKGWKLVWADEFEGHELDRSKWDFDIGNGFYDYKNHAWVPGWGNEELQYYTHEPENVVVRDSCLVIRAVKEPLHGCGYTSARLKTRQRDGTPLFTKLYGRVEFRAKVPWGKGLWPALWMLPVDDKYGGWAASGEIDSRNAASLSGSPISMMKILRMSPLVVAMKVLKFATPNRLTPARHSSGHRVSAISTV